MSTISCKSPSFTPCSTSRKTKSRRSNPSSRCDPPGGDETGVTGWPSDDGVHARKRALEKRQSVGRPASRPVAAPFYWLPSHLVHSCFNLPQQVRCSVSHSTGHN